MSTKFYISDWHYGHKNCIAFDNRPFFTLEEMNRALIDNWNNRVGPGDVVYILGDMFWCKSTEAIPVMDELNGTKILIKGNHDRVNDSKFAEKFSKVCDYLEVKDGDNHIVLSHYPIPCFKNHYHGWHHFYGHVHSSYEFNMMEYQKFLMEELYQKPCKMFNVGAMMPWVDYTPRTFDEIVGFDRNSIGQYTFGRMKHDAKEATVSPERLEQIKEQFSNFRAEEGELDV